MRVNVPLYQCDYNSIYTVRILCAEALNDKGWVGPDSIHSGVVVLNFLKYNTTNKDSITNG